MRARGRRQKRGGWWVWPLRLALALAGVLLLILAIVPLTIGPRLLRRIPCQVTINGRLSREASVYRSDDGTLLVDLRHAPTHADTEGGGYLVQPYWNRLRSISHDYYQLYGPLALLKDVWSPGVELSPENEFLPFDPQIAGYPSYLSFWGLENDHVEIFGKAMLEPIKE